MWHRLCLRVPIFKLPDFLPNACAARNLKQEKGLDRLVPTGLQTPGLLQEGPRKDVLPPVALNLTEYPKNVVLGFNNPAM